MLALLEISPLAARGMVSAGKKRRRRLAGLCDCAHVERQEAKSLAHNKPYNMSLTEAKAQVHKRTHFFCKNIFQSKDQCKHIKAMVSG